jgi:cell wall-associated NlpC family hydrolase
MNRKKIAAIGTIVLLTTGSGAAFAQMSELSNSTTEQIRITKVTKTPSIINPPAVVKESTFVGPVRVSALSLGPILKNTSPEPGSVEWMAQEKAEKDKLKTDAELKQEELEAEISRLEKVARDTKNLNKALALTKKYVGKTWYALGGSTPDAWDCSGLVLWMYAHLDVTLYHSASVQKEAGIFVTEPKIGDIVAFTYKGYSRAFHTAIYTGPDEMLHSGGKKGDRTEIASISRWAKGNGNAEVTYTRIVETNN